MVVVLVSISLAVITLDYREGESGPLAGLGRTALAAMAPLQEAVTTVTRPIGDFFSGLVHLPSLEDENRRLRERAGALSAQAAVQTDMESQIEQLSDLLELKESLTPTSVAAVVIANGLSNFRYTITINEGSIDGVEDGSARGDRVGAGAASGRARHQVSVRSRPRWSSSSTATRSWRDDCPSRTRPGRSRGKGERDLRDDARDSRHVGGR